MYRIEIAGEDALIIYFNSSPLDNNSALEISAQVQQATKRLAIALKRYSIDQIPSYASLLLIFDPLRIDHFKVRKIIANTIGTKSNPKNDVEKIDHESNIIELPVYYSEESGPDLSQISKHSGLSIDEIITIHQSMTYRVYAIGFAPGFAFLGQVDKRIASPRLNTPRLQVPRGAVGIADQQTAIYPEVSPGGWNIIGISPTRMFDSNSSPNMPVKVGDDVRFKKISKNEFISLGGELGDYK